jgi:hypothetical protein
VERTRLFAGHFGSGSELTPVYVPQAIRGLFMFPVVYCRGEGPDLALVVEYWPKEMNRLT